MDKLVIFLCLAAGLATADVELGTCPEWTNIATFDVPSYVGRWYEIKRIPAGIEENMICSTADYGVVNATTITVKNSANLLGELITIEGYGYATNISGQLIVLFPGESAGFYNVLDTDYQTYTCVYSCEQIGEYKQEYAWLMSRTETLDPVTLEMAEQVFIDNGVDVSKLQFTPQGGDCLYYPPAPTIAP